MRRLDTAGSAWGPGGSGTACLKPEMRFLPHSIILSRAVRATRVIRYRPVSLQPISVPRVYRRLANRCSHQPALRLEQRPLSTQASMQASEGLTNISLKYCPGSVGVTRSEKTAPYVI